MNNLQLYFADCNNSAFGGRKILFTPTISPEITSSYLTTADSYQFSTSFDGTLTASVVANTYKVDIAAPTPGFSFYMTATETGSYITSGSIHTGSAQAVFFDLFNLVKDPTKVKKLTLTPSWNYPKTYSGSIIVLSPTSSVPDSNGYSLYNYLVPGIYQCDAFGKVDTTFFISVPATYYSTWNAKDLLIIRPVKGIPVRLTNLDNSYVLTVSSSDARYFPISGQLPVQDTSSWAINSISASHALQADSASWALTASFALNGGSTITDIDGGNASSNYGGVIQSPIFGGNA